MFAKIFDLYECRNRSGIFSQSVSPALIGSSVHDSMVKI